MVTTERLITQLVEAMRAPRGRKFVHAGGRGMEVRTPGEVGYYLPNGTYVKISTDDSGVATQIEENDHLHAVVRPKPITSSFFRGGQR